MELTIPEGPEVKRMVENLQVLEGKAITSVKIASGRYSRGMSHDADRLVGAQLTQVLAKGKLIVFHLRKGEPFAATSTLGMTGRWVVLKEMDSSYLDKYRRIELKFEDGTVAAFFDARNFGTFKVVSFAEAKRKQAELGPDILTEPRSWAAIALPEFIARVKRFAKKQTLADGLLDQRICSGCGIYIRSDALYLARFSPYRMLAEMNDVELTCIWRALHIIAVHALLDEVPPISINAFPYARKAGREFSHLTYQQNESPTGAVIETFFDREQRPGWWSPNEQF